MKILNVLLESVPPQPAIGELDTFSQMSDDCAADGASSVVRVDG